MTHTPESAPAEVTQADLDAAAVAYEAVGWRAVANALASGFAPDESDPDCLKFVQAFARHRQAAAAEQSRELDAPWRDAVDHELVVSLEATADSYASPKDAVNALLLWTQQVALDPRVSQGARDLQQSPSRELVELREALLGIRELAKEAHEHWDADRDMKAGKIIMAIAGRNPDYDARADKIDALTGGKSDDA